jgi:hypothetical protein
VARAVPPKSGAPKKGPNRAAQAALKEAVDALPLIADEKPAVAPAADRPTEYSPEVVEAICTRIANGEILKNIFADPLMPCRKTFFNWRRAHPEAQAAYLLAKEVQVEAYVEETIEIADEKVWNKEDATRNKLRVSARQWYAEKLVPKQYGTKIGIGGAEGLPPVKSEGKLDVDLTLSPPEAYKRMLGG